MTKKPSDRTLLKQNKERIAALEAELAKAQTEVKVAAEAKEKGRQHVQDLEQAVEEVHGFLDAVEGAPARAMPHPRGWGEITLSPVARFAAYLAGAKKLEATK